MPGIEDFDNAADYVKWHSDTKHAALDQSFIDMMIRQKGEAWVAEAIEEKMDRENELSSSTR